MKDLAVIAIAAAVAAGAGLTVNYVRGTDYWGTDYFCPPPSGASVATLFAPCQAFDTAMGHKITKKEAVQMGLLMPDEQSTQPVTRLAEGSAVSERIDPKAVSASMQLVMRRIL